MLCGDSPVCLMLMSVLSAGVSILHQEDGYFNLQKISTFMQPDLFQHQYPATAGLHRIVIQLK